MVGAVGGSHPGRGSAARAVGAVDPATLAVLHDGDGPAPPMGSDQKRLAEALPVTIPPRGTALLVVGGGR